MAGTKKNSGAGKTTMNLMVRRRRFRPRVMLPLLAALIVLTLTALKFGFLDPVSQRVAAAEALGDKQSQLADLAAQLVDYDAVADEYSRYSNSAMTDEEAALTPRTDVVALVQTGFAGTGAAVDGFAVSGNTLTIQLHGVTLARAGEIAASLRGSEIVAAVNTTAAKSEGAAGLPAEVTMTVYLQKGAQTDG